MGEITQAIDKFIRSP